MKYKIYIPTERYSDHIEETYEIAAQSTQLLEAGLDDFKYVNQVSRGISDSKLRWFNVWLTECEPTMITILTLKLGFMVKEYESHTENI